MNLFYLIIFFILGLFMGSFYTVVGTRIPKGDGFITGHSHCESCLHPLSFLDMIPVLSYSFLRGKCRYCHQKFSSLSTWMEIFTGILFALSFFVFGFSYQLFFALGIVSMLIILSITDISYMIIPDSVLIFFSGYFLILIALEQGVIPALIHIVYGMVLFFVMYLIMLLGNYIFKKESLGGGDIKMMFVFGLLLSPVLGILCIFLGSVLALPMSFLLVLKKNEHIIPFGPFLLIALTFLYFLQINTSMILELFP